MSDQVNEPVIEQVSAPEHSFDPSTVKPILHNWVDRGLKLSCEGAGHPHHEAWKRLPKGQPM